MRWAEADVGSTSQAIGAFQAAGGVVEFVALTIEEGDGDGHPTAAAAGMSALLERQAPWTHSVIRRSPSDWYSEVGQPSSGIAVSLQEFVGRGYDFDRACLVDLWDRDPETGTAVKHGGLDGVTDAYAEAFLDPPYGLRAGADKASQWFSAINRDLLGGLHEGLDIRRWGTDWSPWFEAGREWWGAHYWTIKPPDRHWWVVVAASATD